MPFTLKRVIEKIDTVPNADNVALIKEIDKYLQEMGSGERHRKNLLLSVIYYGTHLGPEKTFLDINDKDQITAFLNTKIKSKEKDPDERWRVTWNHYLNYLIIFFKWLHNQRGKRELVPMDEWELPGFVKIKRKKIIHETYAIPEEWDDPQDVLLVVKYMPELRNKLALTFLWDCNGRNHEVTKTEWRHIQLMEKYGEGEIPANTKTGTRGVLLMLSFTHMRDWKNQYPFVMHPRAPIIPNLANGKHVKPEALRSMLIEHRNRCRRKLAKGEIEPQDRERIKFLLETKRWNPYCFRHSSVDIDLAELPEFAARKKIGWSLTSKQPSHYGKRRMNQNIKVQLLASRAGVLLEEDGKAKKPTTKTCPYCQLVNSIEIKHCSKCGRPLSFEALEEVKAKEKSSIEQALAKVLDEHPEYLDNMMDKFMKAREARQKEPE